MNSIRRPVFRDDRSVPPSHTAAQTTTTQGGPTNGFVEKCSGSEWKSGGGMKKEGYYRYKIINSLYAYRIYSMKCPSDRESSDTAEDLSSMGLCPWHCSKAAIEIPTPTYEVHSLC